MEPAGPRLGRGHPGYPGETEPTRDRDGQGGVLDKSLGPVYRRPGIQPSSSGQSALCPVPCWGREAWGPRTLDMKLGSQGGQPEEMEGGHGGKEDWAGLGP